MKTYKEFLAELSLTKLVRYKQAAQKRIKILVGRDWQNHISDKQYFRAMDRVEPEKVSDSIVDYVDRNAAAHEYFSRRNGVELAARKINKKLQVGRLNKENTGV